MALSWLTVQSCGGAVGEEHNPQPQCPNTGMLDHLPLDLTGLDEIGGALCNGVERADQVATDLKGKDGGVNHTHVVGAVDHEVAVDNTTHVPGHHGGGTDGMEVGTS